MSLAGVTVWPQIGHDLLLAWSDLVSIGRDSGALERVCPAGNFEGMTTPLTLASCSSSKGVMMGISFVSCELGILMFFWCFVDALGSDEEKERGIVKCVHRKSGVILGGSVDGVWLQEQPRNCELGTAKRCCMFRWWARPIGRSTGRSARKTVFKCMRTLLSGGEIFAFPLGCHGVTSREIEDQTSSPMAN